MGEYRDNWEHWMTRIPKKDSEELLELGNLFVKKNLIPRADRYHICRYALKALLRTMKQREISNTNKTE